MQAWPSLNAYWRGYYVKAIMGFCKNPADWKGHMLAGVDVNEPTSWRSEVQKLPGDHGFKDCSKAWQLWWH